MADENYEELVDAVNDLADYYSDIIGRNIGMGVDTALDVWLESTRTNGREYFESIEEAERRVKLLYSDLVPDEDDEDPLEGF
jgi:hypothetical protein